MVSLRFLAGSRAGETVGPLKLPVSVGRSSGDQVRLGDDGVWEGHLRVEHGDGGRIVASRNGEAIVGRNGEPLKASAAVGNGDCFTLGSASFEIWLSAPVIKPLWRHEWPLWLMVAAALVAQIWMVAFL